MHRGAKQPVGTFSGSKVGRSLSLSAWFVLSECDAVVLFIAFLSGKSSSVCCSFACCGGSGGVARCLWFQVCQGSRRVCGVSARIVRKKRRTNRKTRQVQVNTSCFFCACVPPPASGCAPQLGDSRVAPAMRCRQKSSLGGMSARAGGGWAASDGRSGGAHRESTFTRASGANFCAFSQGAVPCEKEKKRPAYWCGVGCFALSTIVLHVSDRLPRRVRTPLHVTIFVPKQRCLRRACFPCTTW